MAGVTGCSRVRTWNATLPALLLPCLAFLALGTAAGCAKAPIAKEATDNPEIQYEVLLNRSGCEVGRFTDHGRPVYVTMCPEAGTSASMSSWVEQCGDRSKSNCWVTVDRQQMQVRSPGRDPGSPGG